MQFGLEPPGISVGKKHPILLYKKLDFLKKVKKKLVNRYLPLVGF